MFHILASFILLLLLAFQTKSEQVWNGALEYNPPFRMLAKTQRSTEGSPHGVTTFCTSGTNTAPYGVAQVTFALTSAEEAGPPLPGQPLRTVADLKSLLSTMLDDDSRGAYYSVTNITLDGRPALMCTTITNRIPQGPSNWLCSAAFFWEQNAAWEKSTICAITMTAEKRDTLKLLANSLNTVRVHRGRAAAEPQTNLTSRAAVGRH